MSKHDALSRILRTFSVDDGELARRSREGARKVAQKYAKLRRSPYKLFRATNPTFIGDLEAMPEWWRLACHEIVGPLLGDGHPENLGAVGASAATAQVDCTDFDVVVSAPLARDLARAVCGFALAEDQRLPRDHDDDRALAHALDGAPSQAALDRARLFALTWGERLLTGQGGMPGAAAFAEALAAVDTPIADLTLDESTHAVEPHPGEPALDEALASYAATTPAVRGAKLVHAWLLSGKGASSFCTERTILRLALAEGTTDSGHLLPREILVEWKPQPDARTVAEAYRDRRSPATRDPFLGLASIAGVGHVAQRWMADAQKVKSKDLRGQHADDVAQLMAVRMADLHRRFTPSVIERVRGQPLETIADALVDLVTAFTPVMAAEWRAFLALTPDELVKKVAE